MLSATVRRWGTTYSSLNVSLTILICFHVILNIPVCILCPSMHYFTLFMCRKNKKKSFVLLRFGSVVHPCSYKLSKVLSLFNDNIYKVHIISYSKSCITSMVISTEGSEHFFKA